MLGQGNARGRLPDTTGDLPASPAPAYSGPPVVVLANRAPFRHDRVPGGGISVRRSSGGLVTAIEPLVKACSGVWVACAAGDADDAPPGHRPATHVPRATREYRLRYVSLPENEYQGYYYGFANEGLWPLCHRTPVRPAFRPADFHAYRTVNGRFAAAVCEEAPGDAPVVFVNDYHFALAPRLVRHGCPAATIVAFWHIPWPQTEALRTCPWGRELLDGLLGADIIGLQTQQDCRNFLQCAESTLRCDVDRARSAITYRGRSTVVRAYPVGVEWRNTFVRTAPAVAVCRDQVRRQLGLDADVRLGVGVDRLDYTKGINEKFLAVERLLESRPDLRGRFAFVQVAEPSRECLAAYREARAQLLHTSARVNARFGVPTCRPIVLLEDHHEPSDVYRLYRAADLCYVGSLHDGMNLVSKEFVCARDDERGVLVLSRFAGASRQLRAALKVNPYSVDEAAQALGRALDMSNAEAGRRMRQLRHVVARFDTRWWAGQILGDAARLQDAASASALDDQYAPCSSPGACSSPWRPEA